MTGLLLLALAWAQEPTDQTLIYYNARMALREGHPDEAVRLWLLRNAVEDQTGQVSAHDPDFHSLTWAALGEMGVCPDGHPTDEEGAGLWPLALHNWVVRNMGRRGSPAPSRPFGAFDVGRQQRFISITDVLNAKELSSVHFFRGPCTLPRLALMEAGELPNAQLSDRQVAARLLRDLLEQARVLLDPELVRGQAAIEARLFDLDLQLTALAAREARKEEVEQARRARQLGLKPPSVQAAREEAPDTTLDPNSEAARILRASAGWPVWEWMSLSSDRRLFLFDNARAYGEDPLPFDAIALEVLDRLIRAGEGEEVEKWIARAERPEVVWSGDRGLQLLALDREMGFRERSVIALHRGVNHLEQGELPEALRSLAFALQHAPDSRDAETVESLSLRWLSYVASRFEITDELLVTLKELVPRREYAILLEDLMWRAALHADRTSFERGLGHQSGRNALSRRLVLLGPLSEGDLNDFSQRIRIGLRESPSETLQFVDQLIQRMELEDGDVRTAHIPTLESLIDLLQPLASEGEGRQGRKADDLVHRSQAILEGLGALDPDAGPEARARSLDPAGEVFVGSLRLAPADPLPWPFRATEPPAPSVFVPLDLTPEEWVVDGETVFGWSIGG